MPLALDASSHPARWVLVVEKSLPGGIFIKTETPREEGSVIYLQFTLRDGSKLIEGMGKVVRVNPPGDPKRPGGMGIEFMNFDEESMALIAEICAQRTNTKN